MKYKSTICLLLLMVAQANLAQAGTMALTITGGTTKADFGGTVGFSFTVGSQAISVTDLGYYNGVGYQGTTGVVPTTHQVGIYNDATQALLGSATVSYDGTPAGGGSFIYVPVTPFTLLANTTYDIVGSNISGSSTTTGNQAYLVNATGASMASGLTYGTSRYGGSSATLAYPNNTFSGNNVGNIGANFQFTPVPEPSTLALAVIGLLGAVATFRFRRLGA